MTALPATTSDEVVNGVVTSSSSGDLLPLPSGSKTNGWPSTTVSSAASSSFDPSLSDLDYLERPLNDLDDDDSDEESLTVAASGGDSCRSNGSVKLSSSATTSSGGRGSVSRDSTSAGKRSGKTATATTSLSKDASSSSR